jgi:Zn-dependent protease with chaperone function
VARQSGLTDGMGVMEALAGSPAQQAGLVGGDEIVALNDAAVTTLGLPRQGRVASYARVEAFTGLLDAALARGGAWLTVRRSGANRRVFIALREGCAVRFVMLPGRKAAAWSDERYAAASEALAKDAGESELAFALAHEMAHVVLGHAEAERPPLASLGFGGAKTRAREREADELGILISLDAGYDVEGAEALLQRLTRAQTGISLTHPSLTERMVAIRRVADTALKTRHAGDP